MCFYTPFYFYFFLFLFVGYALGSLCVITCAITGFYLRASVAFFVPRIRATYITVNIFIIVVRMNANARSFLYKPRCILFAACVYMCECLSLQAFHILLRGYIVYVLFLTGAVCVACLISYDLCRLIRVFRPIHALLCLVFWPDRVVIECVSIIVVKAVEGGSVEMALRARLLRRRSCGQTCHNFSNPSPPFQFTFACLLPVFQNSKTTGENIRKKNERFT